MKKLLFTNDQIIKQGEELLAALLEELAALNIPDKKEIFIAPMEMKEAIFQLGIDIALINQVQPIDIAEEFKFFGLPAECYISVNDSYLTLGMNLLIALAERDDKSIDWYEFIGDEDEDERDCMLRWNINTFWKEMYDEFFDA